MVCTWCMRYEATHSYFKRLAMFMGNFTKINVAVSLGERHQTRTCYMMSTQAGSPRDELLTRKPKIGIL